MTTSHPVSGEAFNAAHDRGPSGRFTRMTHSAGKDLPAPAGPAGDLAERAERRDAAYRTMGSETSIHYESRYEAVRQESLGLAAAALLDSHPDAATLRIQRDETGLHLPVSLADADGGLLEYTADDDTWTRARAVPGGISIEDLAASIEPDEITLPEGVITGYGGGPARSFNHGARNARFYDINLAAAAAATVPLKAAESIDSLPHPSDSRPHPMTQWPEGRARPASVDFSSTGRYADPASGVDHVRARITMANGAAAVGRQARIVSPGTGQKLSAFDELPQIEFSGDWDPYVGSYQELQQVRDTAFEYLSQIQDDRPPQSPFQS